MVTAGCSARGGAAAGGGCCAASGASDTSIAPDIAITTARTCRIEPTRLRRRNGMSLPCSDSEMLEPYCMAAGRIFCEFWSANDT